MYTWEQAVDIIRQRRNTQSILLQRMIQVRDYYNGDIILPLPAEGIDKDKPPLIAHLIDEAIDAPAMRAASTMPAIFCPAVDPTRDTGARSRDNADRRRKALAAVLYNSSFNLTMRRMYRHIGGYGMSSLLLLADDDCKMPKIVLRDPMTTYAEARAPEDMRPPKNVGYIHQKSAVWLVQKYGAEVTRQHGGPIDTTANQWDSELWDTLEWVDADQYLIGIMGPSSPTTRQLGNPALNYGMLLKRFENPLGMTPAVTPNVITLDGIVSRVNHMIGKVDAMAYLLDLDRLATEKSIFPDRYALGDSDTNAPTIVSNGGIWQDGRTGKTNLLKNVRAVGELQASPNPAGMQLIQYLERNARVGSGTVSAYGGETSGPAMRTGRGLDSMMGAAVDPRVQELQEIACEALRHLADPIFTMFEKHWGDQKYTMFSGWAGDVGHVEIKPSKHFPESHETVFSYAVPGADSGQITVMVGQLVGAGLLDKHSARTMHPHISDASAVEHAILEENLDEMLLGSLQQRMQSGGIPPVDAALLRRAIRHGSTLDEAILLVDEASKKRQAAEAPQPEPGQAVAPEAMPGLANPGEGAESQLPPEAAAAPPGGAPAGLEGLLAAMKQAPPGGPGGAPQGAPIPAGAH